MKIINYLKSIENVAAIHWDLLAKLWIIEEEFTIVWVNLDRLLSYSPLILLIKELMIMAIRHMEEIPAKLWYDNEILYIITQIKPNFDWFLCLMNPKLWLIYVLWLLLQHNILSLDFHQQY
jgi:hypothetical protein